MHVATGSIPPSRETHATRMHHAPQTSCLRYRAMVKVQNSARIWFSSALGLAVGVGLYYGYSRYPSFGKLHYGRLVPPSGIEANPNSKVSIHPEDVEDDFKTLYS